MAFPSRLQEKLRYAAGTIHSRNRCIMKPIFPIIALTLLGACVAPDIPVEVGEPANPAIAESQCRAAAAKEGLTVRQITAFREIVSDSGPSGLSAVMTVGGAASGEARCVFQYATGKAEVTLY
jgi:hypothetical protein